MTSMYSLVESVIMWEEAGTCLSSSTALWRSQEGPRRCTSEAEKGRPMPTSRNMSGQPLPASKGQVICVRNSGLTKKQKLLSKGKEGSRGRERKRRYLARRPHVAC
jgi:hypothetical protein